ncbi:sodium/calcium exchanger NCL1-like [Henckelia pumila]|uniref:sodium/calcium exchanger NCL1-like n=1 Tax=Henckelia pumila TaxID=405737 RepID=UPI003C6E5862
MFIINHSFFTMKTSNNNIANSIFTLSFIFLVSILLSIPAGVISRPFSGNSLELVSDGVDGLIQSSVIIKTSTDNNNNNSSWVLDEKCEQMYGFLPCSYSVTGHLFLILVYEYLLFHAESYVASGGERIFKILGPGVFGASAFQIIGSLPEALILLASGLLSSEELAEEYVFTGVGLLAGSTILLLTVIWGTCIILGSQKFRDPANFNPSDKRSHTHLERFLMSKWPGYGVVTDMGTSVTARILLISVIPSMVVLIPEIFGLSLAGERVVVIVTLFVSITFLLSYFFYQFFKPWIQRRRLLYVKHEYLVIDILKRVQSQTKGKLLTENGSPNISTIRNIFKERDQDGDNLISLSELKEFLKEIKFRKLHYSDEDRRAEEMMKDFDADNDQKITMDEFVRGMMKWLDDTKETMNKRYHSVRSLKDLYKVLKPWISKKREEREMMSRLIPDILEYLQSSACGGLLAKDGTPDVTAIKRLFKKIDLDKDDCISYDELKQLMTNIKFGMMTYDADIAASKIMEELDVSGDHLIDEEEFVMGLSKWLSTTYNQKPDSEKTEEEYYQKTWEQTDKLMEDKFVDKSPLAWTKAIGLLVLGIVVLGLLAEPLVHSVRAFSKAANLPSFYIAFMFIPLASNARLAVSAITEARRKKLHTTSLTLSEIYGTVFMNNILGLAVLLALIYYRGMSWDFSAEVFVVLVVSVIIGCLSSFSTVFPIWASLLAYLMYPLSLVLVYILGDSTWFS